MESLNFPFIPYIVQYQCIIVYPVSRLLELLEQYKTVWRARYLEAGLQFSLANLRAVLKQFIPDTDPRLHTDAEETS